jgi:hypothetical protein
VSSGWHNFVWFILGLVPVEKINEAEKAAIDKYNTLTSSQGGNGYNIMKGGDGGERSKESLERQRATMATAGSIEKRSEISKRMWTEEYKINHRGKNGRCPEAREKRAISLKAARQRSDVIQHHVDGGRRMWSGESGDKRRRTIQKRKEDKIAELLKTSELLPELERDRVHGTYYIIKVPRKRLKPGQLCRWTIEKLPGGGVKGV